MEPLSWVSQYPAGIMVVADDGTVSVPAANNHETVPSTAKTRALDLINTGSTHKLKPLKFEHFNNELRRGVSGGTKSSSWFEHFSIKRGDEGQSDFVTVVVLLLALLLFAGTNRKRLYVGFLLLGVSVLLKILSSLVI